MKQLKTHDIERLDNTSIASALVAAGTVGGDEDILCGHVTCGEISCVALSCINDSNCHQDSLCGGDSCNACEEVTCGGGCENGTNPCEEDTCEGDTGCNGETEEPCAGPYTCDRYTICEGGSIATDPIPDDRSQQLLDALRAALNQ